MPGRLKLVLHVEHKCHRIITVIECPAVSFVILPSFSRRKHLTHKRALISCWISPVFISIWTDLSFEFTEHRGLMSQTWRTSLFFFVLHIQHQILINRQMSPRKGLTNCYTKSNQINRTGSVKINPRVEFVPFLTPPVSEKWILIDNSPSTVYLQSNFLSYRHFPLKTSLKVTRWDKGNLK